MTQAYKDQMAEVRKAEQEEKEREGELNPRVRSNIQLSTLQSGNGKEEGVWGPAWLISIAKC